MGTNFFNSPQVLRSSLYRAVQIVCFYIMLLWLGLLLLLGNLVCIPLLLLPKKWGEPFGQGFISATFRLFLASCQALGLMKLQTSSLDSLNDQKGFILAPNHPSMIDVFLVISRVRRATCLMKANLGLNIFLGVGARLAGYIANRSRAQTMSETVQDLKSGTHVLIFPEGTRTVRHPMNELKKGVAFMALRARAPIQLIILLTNSPYLSKGWPIWRAPPAFPLIYRASLGERIEFVDDDFSVQDIIEKLKTAYEQALDNNKSEKDNILTLENA